MAAPLPLMDPSSTLQGLACLPASALPAVGPTLPLETLTAAAALGLGAGLGVPVLPGGALLPLADLPPGLAMPVAHPLQLPAGSTATTLAALA